MSLVSLRRYLVAALSFAPERVADEIGVIDRTPMLKQANKRDRLLYYGRWAQAEEAPGPTRLRTIITHDEDLIVDTATGVVVVAAETVPPRHAVEQARRGSCEADPVGLRPPRPEPAKPGPCPAAVPAATPVQGDTWRTRMARSDGFHRV